MNAVAVRFVAVQIVQVAEENTGTNGVVSRGHNIVLIV